MPVPVPHILHDPTTFQAATFLELPVPAHSTPTGEALLRAPSVKGSGQQAFGLAQLNWSPFCSPGGR